MTDGDAAGRLAESLQSYFGESSFFLDVSWHSLPPGSVWPQELRLCVESSRIVLAVIGPSWYEGLRSRPKKEDWVRQEIGLALKLGKIVIPVLLQGAAAPTRAQLPRDLWGLADRQALTLPNFGQERSVAIERLLKRLQAERPIEVPPGSTIPFAKYEPLVQEVYSPMGQPWSPDSEKDSPHSFDYKFSILDPEVRRWWRESFLQAKLSGELNLSISLQTLSESGVRRKFSHSERKQGLFLQASCIVTDGFDDGKITHVLLCMRERYQFHAGNQIRNVKGESVLFGTCVSTFDLHDSYGHVPKDLFNSYGSLNPWALFSRKLLVPDLHIDVRFAGIGFNFEKPLREYIHLIWHVRTKRRSDLVLVPARQKENYDVPVWRTLQEVVRYDFEDALIDRLVLQRLKGLELPLRNDKSLLQGVGFLTCPHFQRVWKHDAPVRWHRDTLGFDLLLMYQQEVHWKRRAVKSAEPEEILSDLQSFLRLKIQDVGLLPLDVHFLQSPIQPEFRGPARLLYLTIRENAQDGDGTLYESLITAVVSEAEELTSDLVEKCRREIYSALPLMETRSTSLFVLHGVESDMRFRLQGAVTLDGQPPVHVVKVAIKGDVEVKPEKNVAHAVIPVRRESTGPVVDLIVTRSDRDELARLPGGKIEGEETPSQALLRELFEELGLSSSNIKNTIPVPNSPICLEANSPSTGYLTMYRLSSFLVTLTSAGVNEIRRRITLQAPGTCRVMTYPLADWRQYGLGFDPGYAEQILTRLTPEELERAAIEL